MGGGGSNFFFLHFWQLFFAFFCAFLHFFAFSDMTRCGGGGGAQEDCLVLWFVPELMFNVKLTSRITITARHRVVFDNVTSNIGNGYDNVTGIFTVPYNRSYELTVTNMGTSGGMYTNILLNNGLRLCNAHGPISYAQGEMDVTSRTHKYTSPTHTCRSTYTLEVSLNSKLAQFAKLTLAFVMADNA